MSILWDCITTPFQDKWPIAKKTSACSGIAANIDIINRVILFVDLCTVNITVSFSCHRELILSKSNLRFQRYS